MGVCVCVFCFEREAALLRVLCCKNPKKKKEWNVWQKLTTRYWGGKTSSCTAKLLRELQNPRRVGNRNRGNQKKRRGTEGVGRRGRGSPIKSLCLSILSRLSPTQPGSIDFVWGLERPTAADYLGEWAVQCKQTVWPGLFQSQHGPWQTTHTENHAESTHTLRCIAVLVVTVFIHLLWSFCWCWWFLTVKELSFWLVCIIVSCTVSVRFKTGSPLFR